MGNMGMRAVSLRNTGKEKRATILKTVRRKMNKTINIAVKKRSLLSSRLGNGWCH